MGDTVRKEAMHIPRMANPIERSVAVNGEEYRILSPIVIDLERGSISFAVQRDITATDGKVYTISERIVLHDGIEARSVQLPNGKTVMSPVRVSRFSAAWGIIGEAFKEMVKRGIVQMKGNDKQTPNKGE